MSGKPGQKKTGGRQKGTPNKLTSDIQAKLDKMGCDPIKGMADLAKIAIDTKDFHLAGNMYRELAQYVAPKRKAVEISSTGEGVTFNLNFGSGN